MGGKKASQGESRTVNASNTLPKYNEQHSDEEGVKKVNDKKEQIKNRVNKKGKSNYPNKEEKEMLKNKVNQHKRFQRNLSKEKKREISRGRIRKSNDPDPVFMGKDGFMVMKKVNG